MDHYHIYRKLAENQAFKYTTIRTLDIGGDKFASKIEVPKEINPAMGLRAIRLCIKEVDLFKAQLRGISRASAYGPLKILFPDGLRHGGGAEGEGDAPGMHGGAAGRSTWPSTRTSRSASWWRCRPRA